MGVRVSDSGGDINSEDDDTIGGTSTVGGRSASSSSSSSRSSSSSDVYIKDYLLPMVINDYNKTIECIPKHMREDVNIHINSYLEKYSDLSSSTLATIALCYTIRLTAFEEYRALITYNSNSDDWPDSRDNVYIAVLSNFIYKQLISPESIARRDPTGTGNMKTGLVSYSDVLLQNLIAIAALDESIGVREPRAAVTQAFAISIRAAITHFLDKHPSFTSTTSSTTPTTSPTAATAPTTTASTTTSSTSSSIELELLKNNINEMEKLLILCLRYPPTNAIKCRQQAFQQYIDSLLTPPQFNTTPNNPPLSNTPSTASAFKKLDSQYMIVADILGIDPKVAKRIVAPLGLNQFDKVSEYKSCVYICMYMYTCIFVDVYSIHMLCYYTYNMLCYYTYNMLCYYVL